jgi:poly(3-hydroxybutyrate) depolymerase
LAPAFTGVTTQSISVSGQNRTYTITIPSGYDSNTPYALILGYHGFGDVGNGARGAFNLESTANNKAIFAYPDGAGGVWTLTETGADILMFDALLASLSSKFCIDQKAVFAMGFSYGGWMTNALGCYRGNKLNGFISVAGGGPGGTCPGAPTPAMIVHGSMDTAEPPRSGEASRDFWRGANQCGSSSSDAAPSPCVQYSGCAKPVLWCLHPADHRVPNFVTTGAWAWFNSLR